MSSLALPAFVASAASTLSLQSDILSGCVSSDNSYLFQRFSLLVQRFNAVLLHDSLPDRDCTDY